MDFSLSEEHRMIRDLARDFAQREVAPGAAERDETGEFPLALFKRAAELGLAGVVAPEEYGGAGLDSLSLTLALIEINAVDASLGVTLSVHNTLAQNLIIKHATEEARRKYLPKLATGEWIGCYALSEAFSGSDAAALRTTATRDGDGYRLNGVKTWITQGDQARVAVVFARTGRTGRSKDISAFIVDCDAEGFSIGTKEEKMGIRSSSTVELVLENVSVPAENLLGAEGEGFRLALATLDGGRIGIAAQAVGIARACLEASVKYANEREQFGQKIGEFQAIQWKIADMSARLAAAEVLTLRAAWLRDQGVRHTVEAAQAKLIASMLANDAARDAVQIHGGAGYTREFPVERYLRDARVTEIYEGTTEIQRLVIARNLLRE